MKTRIYAAPAVKGLMAWFQVHAFYQRCNTHATCNCGVVIKSGDTVFFVDRCRKKSGKCKGHKCRNMMTVSLMYWDRITPGTYIASKYNGQQYEVSQHVSYVIYDNMKSVNNIFM